MGTRIPRSPEARRSDELADRPHSIAFGWGAPLLADQLQGFALDSEDLRHWQLDAEAIGRLSVRRRIPRSSAEKAYRALAKVISRAITKAQRNSA